MSVIAYILINIKRGGEGTVVNEIRKKPGVLYADELYGGFDIIIKIEKENMEEIQKFLIDYLRKIEDIEKTKTLIAIKDDS